MIRVTVHAEDILPKYSTPNLMRIEYRAGLQKAAEIIQGMNLRITPDPNGVLAAIQKWDLKNLFPSDIKCTNIALELMLNGIPIHRDEELAKKINAQLREQNFYARERF